MSLANPTSLRVGQRGAFQGWQVTITGRVVLSVEVEGETYYWNEYILTGDNGASGTLVYEEGEDGPEWKLFRMFEPATPLTAREAARLRVGDTVNLTGSPIVITLVDESVVRLIEGTPPEGVERGDVAHYFNADTGRSMLVVSWTGEEIEFYEGHDLPEELVMKGFGLTSAQPERSSLPASKSKSSLGFVILLLAGLAVAAFFFISTCQTRPQRQTGARPASYQTPPAPSQPIVQLTLGSSGTLEQRAYSVAAIASVTIGRREGAREDTEYLLRTATGETALLTRGLMGGTRTWHLFVPTLPGIVSPALDAFSAAALPRNARVNVAERGYEVAELLHAKAGAQQGGEVAAAMWPAVQYGWLARGHEANEAEDWLLARWTETGLHFHRGHSIPEAEVRAAFATVER